MGRLLVGLIRLLCQTEMRASPCEVPHSVPSSSALHQPLRTGPRHGATSSAANMRGRSLLTTIVKWAAAAPPTCRAPAPLLSHRSLHPVLMNFQTSPLTPPCCAVCALHASVRWSSQSSTPQTARVGRRRRPGGLCHWYDGMDALTRTAPVQIHCWPAAVRPAVVDSATQPSM